MVPSKTPSNAEFNQTQDPLVKDVGLEVGSDLNPLASE